MTTQQFVKLGLKVTLLVLLCGACDDDDQSKNGEHDHGQQSDHDHDSDTKADAGKSDAGEAETSADAAAADKNALYLVGSSLSSSDTSSLVLWTSPTLFDTKFEISKGLQIVGGTGALAFDNSVFVANSEDKTITRYSVEKDGTLKAGKKVSFASRGLMYVSYPDAILDKEHAYIVAADQLELIEWNPSTMTITGTHSLEKLKREGWGQEDRGSFVRKSDGKIFIYWTYTNQRTEFVNDFVLGVFDTKTNELTVQVKEDCPASAGFGGFFDEKEDLYLIADSFGLFTQFEYKDAKPACVLRVKKDDSEIDPDYKLQPADAMGGRAPWGFYYLANGLAYSSGVDPAVFKDYDSVFEVLFAPVHTGWLLNLEDGSAKQIEDLPLDGVGFESHHVDGHLLVPRTTGEVTIEDVMSTESTLFDLKADGTAKSVFSLPGYIAPVARIR